VPAGGGTDRGTMPGGDGAGRAEPMRAAAATRPATSDWKNGDLVLLALGVSGDEREIFASRLRSALRLRSLCDQATSSPAWSGRLRVLPAGASGQAQAGS
jgi:hypothetical protein